MNMANKCVVEGCTSEYDVVCSFSFYNRNSSGEDEQVRQDWIQGAMQEDSQVLWRHVSLQLCGYHFEVDAQGLWIDSPVLPELLAVKEQGSKRNDDIIRVEHNYSVFPDYDTGGVSRLNVRQLVDTLGYLSLRNLQRKQLWVAKVESDTAEASITQAEQVITKMNSPSKVIELIPPNTSTSTDCPTQEYQINEDGIIGDNFIYEIAQEEEIAVDDGEAQKDWAVNIITEPKKPKYAFINCNTGKKKKRHFTSDITEYQPDFENYYILPDDVDTTVGVEVTTTDNDNDNYIVNEYVAMYDKPKKRAREEKKKKRLAKVKNHTVSVADEDWSIQNFQDDDDKSREVARVRRKNKKYLGYDFVT